MAVQMFDNLSIQKASPNVERDLFNTVAEMAAFDEDLLPEVFECNVKDTGARYRFDKKNTVDGVTGKWRIVQSATGDYVTRDELQDYAQKTELDAYAKTSDVADTYAQKTELADLATKREVADEYAKKQYSDDTFATKTELADYATKAELEADYATKTELVDEIEKIAKQGLKAEIVDQLPDDDIKTNIIYLIKDGETKYIQWMYIGDKWYNLGSTDVDISMIGNLQNLSTTAKDTLVNAINEVLKSVEDKTKEISDKIGSLDDLQTTTHASAVSAINELKADAEKASQDAQGILDKIGDITQLATDNKANTVSAINELKDKIDTNKDDITDLQAATAKIGDLQDLNTDSKDSVVNAINSSLTMTAKELANKANTLEVANTYATKQELQESIDDVEVDISAEPDNAIEQKDDGLYVADKSKVIQNLQNDKLNLNLDNIGDEGKEAIKDILKDEFAEIKAIVDVAGLPTENIDETVFYRVTLTRGWYWSDTFAPVDGDGGAGYDLRRNGKYANYFEIVGNSFPDVYVIDGTGIFKKYDSSYIVRYGEVKDRQGYPQVSANNSLVTKKFTTNEMKYFVEGRWGLVDSEGRLVKFANVLTEITDANSVKLYHHFNGEWREIGAGGKGMPELAENGGLEIADDKLQMTSPMEVREVEGSITDYIPKATPEQYGLVKLDDVYEIDLKDRFSVPFTQGTIRAYIRGNFVTVSAENLDWSPKVAGNLIQASVPELPDSLCWSNGIIANGTTITGQFIVNKSSKIIFIRSFISLGVVGWGQITYPTI